jgi:plastocyanin
MQGTLADPNGGRIRDFPQRYDRIMRFFVLLLTALALAIAGCGGDEENSGSGGADEAQTVEVDGETANYEGTEEVTGGSVEFEEDDFYFEPTVLTGQAGTKVTLEVFNEGDETHNLTIEDQKVDEDTEPGGEASVDVVIPDDGVAAFFCKFHTAQDMRGALAVTGSEPAPSAAEDDNITSESRGSY